nr:hypothetical protein [Tanacetum cinerariifolium]
MWKAIQTGNSPRPQVTDHPTEAVPHPIAREKTDDEYTDAENLKEQFDIQVAGNYVDIFTHLRTYEPHALKSLKKLE